RRVCTCGRTAWFGQRLSDLAPAARRCERAVDAGGHLLDHCCTGGIPVQGTDSECLHTDRRPSGGPTRGIGGVRPGSPARLPVRGSSHVGRRRLRLGLRTDWQDYRVGADACSGRLDLGPSAAKMTSENARRLACPTFYHEATKVTKKQRTFGFFVDLRALRVFVMKT